MTVKQFFLNPITIIVGIIILLGGVALAGNYFGWFGKKINKKGTPPNPSDCGGMRMGELKTTGNAVNSGLVIGLSPEVQCTRPIYDLSKITDAVEVCFTADELKLKSHDEVPAEITVTYGIFDFTGSKMRFNRQSGRKFCYVYDLSGEYPQL